jgi:hypothetical protein
LNVRHLHVLKLVFEEKAGVGAARKLPKMIANADTIKKINSKFNSNSDPNSMFRDSHVTARQVSICNRLKGGAAKFLKGAIILRNSYKFPHRGRNCNEMAPGGDFLRHRVVQKNAK